jgi:hypothetical protein
MSPPETRSASKKSRRADGDNGVAGGGKPVGCGVMLFSPPDEVSNARREEKERQEKEYDRYALMKMPAREIDHTFSYLFLSRRTQGSTC